MARQTADAILKNSGELTDEQKKALRAGTARAWYADLPGAAADLAGSALDYGAEGLARLLPSDLAGYDLPKSLGIRGFQRAMRDPAGGSKQLEQLGEDIGYIPPSTGTQEEEMARLMMGLADPIPGIPPTLAGPIIQAYGGRANVPQKLVDAIKESTPKIRGLRPYITPDEYALLSPQNIEKMKSIESGGPGVSILGKKTAIDPREIATMAEMGVAKKGWYRNSAGTLTNLFGPGDDARFAALLAATSPQTSVQDNLINSLNIWKNWNAAGRPTEKDEILEVMANSVQGEKGLESVLGAWRPNSIRALQADDPYEIQLSGPKVQSFYKNLTGHMDEVTNDTWQGKALGVEQNVFEAANRKVKGENIGMKSPGYVFSSAATRKAAKIAEEMTGEKWEPAEIQETTWSYVKALMEKRAGSGKRTTQEIAQELTPEEIVEVPDFGTLLRQDPYVGVLNEAGYGERLSSLPDITTEAAEIAPSADALRRAERVNRRLERQFQQGLREAAARAKAKEILNAQ